MAPISKHIPNLPTQEEQEEHLLALVKIAFGELCVEKYNAIRRSKTIQQPDQNQKNKQTSIKRKTLIQCQPGPLEKLVEFAKEHGKHALDKLNYALEHPWELVEDLAGFGPERIADILHAYGISTNHWVFSSGNLKTIHRLVQLIQKTFDVSQRLGFLTSVRYLMAWTIMQKLHSKVEAKHREIAEVIETGQQSAQNELKVNELKTIRQECKKYARYAHAIYGNLINNILSGKDFDTIFERDNLSFQFRKIGKIKKGDLLGRFWDSEPYKPAYAIVCSQENTSILLCMRGTLNWADTITDLDCQYVKFHLVQDNETKKTYLRFIYDDKDFPIKFKHMLGTTTKGLNGSYSSELPHDNEVVLKTGFAHVGMFVSAIQTYKRVTPRIEHYFSEPKHHDYNFVITGHSLGGGMTTLMTFLYMVHPLNVPKESVNKGMKAYAFAPAPVLSKDFDDMFTNRLTSVVFGKDCVPTLSYGAALDISEAQAELDKYQKNDPSFVRHVLDADMGEDFEKIQKDQMDLAMDEVMWYNQARRIMKKNLKLHPMGRTFKIDPVHVKDETSANGFDYVWWEVEDKSYFEEIKFSKNMVEHHFPKYYEAGLQCSDEDVQFRPVTGHKDSVVGC